MIRGIYAWRRGRPFWSPWLCLVAAALAIMSYAIKSAGGKVTASPSIERQQAAATQHGGSGSQLR